MNAGANGGEMKDIVVSASIMDEDGNIRKLDNKELEFGYRTSVLRPGKDIVIDVVIALHPGNQTEIRSRMAEIAASFIILIPDWTRMYTTSALSTALSQLSCKISYPANLL